MITGMILGLIKLFMIFLLYILNPPLLFNSANHFAVCQQILVFLRRFRQVKQYNPSAALQPCYNHNKSLEKNNTLKIFGATPIGLKPTTRLRRPPEKSSDWRFFSIFHSLSQPLLAVSRTTGLSGVALVVSSLASKPRELAHHLVCEFSCLSCAF